MLRIEDFVCGDYRANLFSTFKEYDHKKNDFLNLFAGKIRQILVQGSKLIKIPCYYCLPSIFLPTLKLAARLVRDNVY